MAESESRPFDGIAPKPLKVEVDEAARAAALTRARAGDVLTGDELRLILRVSESTFGRHLRRGEYDAFRVHPRIGAPRFAGLKVAHYIDGEGVRDTDRTFGRRQRAG